MLTNAASSSHRSSNSDVLLYFLCSAYREENESRPRMLIHPTRHALTVFVPPAPVGIKKGCGADIVINIALCFLG